MLDGKDREELHTIAGAMGVKAATRMRKADLIDAILAAANGGDRRPNGDVGRAGAEAAPGALRARVGARARTRSPRSPTKRTALAASDRGRRRHDAAPAAALARPPDPLPPPPHRRRHTVERRGRTGRAAGVEHGDSSDGRLERAAIRATATTPATATHERHRGARRSRRRAAVVRRRQPPRTPSPSRPWRTGPSAGRRRAAPDRVPGRPDRRHGSARPPRRGLRLPPRRRLPPRSEGRLRVGVAGAALRAAQGRLRHAARRDRRRATRSTRRSSVSTTSTA